MSTILKSSIFLFYICIACLIGSGCRSADVGRITPGASREEVRAALGDPTRISHAIVPSGSFSGPQESLSSILAPTSPYEEWRYEGRDTIQYVWFGSKVSADTGQWRVLAVGKYPVGAVF